MIIIIIIIIIIIVIIIIIIIKNAGYGRWVVGLVLYIISFLTTVGNGLVLHAIRTERRLQTVSVIIELGKHNES